jgi:hypothetical protein
VSSSGRIEAHLFRGTTARTPALRRYREILAAHLVLSLADLRLRKRIQERARRTPSNA